MRDAADASAQSQAVETFEDLMLCRHVLAADDPIGWSGLDLPRHQVDEGVADIDLGLVKLVMATAQV